jgi:glycosyltransferase involved in cell wall biosynthesis
MAACVTEPERLAEWRAAGLRRAAEFSWERTARETHAVYQEAVRRG